DYPFPRIVERLNLPRDPSRTALVQATFTLERAHRPEQIGAWRFLLTPSEGRRKVSGLPMEPCHVAQQSSQFDLELILEEGDGTIEGILCYNSDLFKGDTIRRMAGQLVTLLEGAAANPNRRLSELSWLAEDEQQQLVHDCNETQVDFPSGVCLHQ